MVRPGEYRPEGPQPENNADEGPEFGCKYCTKTFQNRQALGGHQNAHKIQRTVEKRARELRDNNNHFGFYGGGGGPVAYSGPYPGPYNNRSNDFVDRAVYNNNNYYYNNPYGPARPVPGFNGVHSGWAAPGLRNSIVPQSAGQVQSHLQTRSVNSVFPNYGMGGSGSGLGSGSGSGSRPVYPDLSGFNAPRVRPGGNTGRGIRDPGNDQQCDDESGIDLSLKL